MTGPFTDLERQALLGLLPPLRLRSCPLRPTARQHAFLLLPDREVFFGGAAGGGKSIAMLMAALQYSDVPGYHALLLRPSLQELQLAGGLLEIAHGWLTGTKARWSGDSKTWRFPGQGRSGAGGASLTFGYLASDADVTRYAGTSYSFLGFDELTKFDETLYRRMFRVLRQPIDLEGAAPDGTRLSDVPIRVRSTSNPGGRGHEWVKNRFITPETKHPDVVFVRSQLADNPHLDISAYIENLEETPLAERMRLLHGNWDVPNDGELFRRDWFTIIEPHDVPTTGTSRVRYWDLAATEPSPGNADPDYTVGLLLTYHRATGNYYVADIVRERRGPGAIEHLIKATAQHDGRQVPIRIEQEPGAAGKHTIDRYRRLLTRHLVRGERPTGDKHTRAWPVAAAAEHGKVFVVRGRHTDAFLDELTSFPHGRHDDCVDALAGAHTTINTHRPSRTHVPRGRITLGLPHHTIHDPLTHLSQRTGIYIHPAPPASLRVRHPHR